MSNTPKFEDWVGIVDVLNRYAEALDSRDWALMEQVFTPDANGTYGGGERIGRGELIANFRRNLGGCGPSQHLLGNYKVEVNGDTARATCRVRVYHTGLGERAKLEPYEMWGFYHDELVRTKEGWRIKHRTLTSAISRGDRNVLQPG